MRKRNWSDFRLYAITGDNYHPGRSVEDVMEQALIGGADIVQLRAKNAPKREILAQAAALRKLTDRYGVPLIINDHIDIAQAVQADGVHLGQEDMPLAEARKLLGPGPIIGISTHHVEQALEAERGGADYIGVGPVFPTATKPGRTAVTTAYVSEAARRMTIPWVAIGGITLDNVDSVLAAGATRICAVSAIVGSDDAAGACREFKRRLQLSAGMRDAAGAGARTVKVNGSERTTLAATVEELVAELGLAGKRLVVELGGVIVARERWRSTPLADGAALELVHFVGGG